MTASSLRPALQAKVMDSTKFSSCVTKYLSIDPEFASLPSLQLWESLESFGRSKEKLFGRTRVLKLASHSIKWSVGMTTFSRRRIINYKVNLQFKLVSIQNGFKLTNIDQRVKIHLDRWTSTPERGKRANWNCSLQQISFLRRSDKLFTLGVWWLRLQMRKLQRNSKAERQTHQQTLGKPHRRGDKKLKGNCKAEDI